MKLFEQKSAPASGLLSNRPFYTLLAVYMPYTLLAAYILFFEAVLKITLPVFLFLTSGAIASISASIYSDFMKDTKSSRISPNIRGGIIIMAVIYLLSCLFFVEGRWNIRFMPNYINIAASLCALYAWTGVISIKQLFSARMKFEKITEKYQGEQLKEELFNDSALMLYTKENVKKIWSYYFNQLVLIGILVLVSVFFKIHLSLLLYLLVIILLASGKGKAKILHDAFFGKITPANPASALQLHQNVTIITDKAAGEFCSTP